MRAQESYHCAFTDPGTAELQLGIVMADPGTAELQLGIGPAEIFPTTLKSKRRQAESEFTCQA